MKESFSRFAMLGIASLVVAAMGSCFAEPGPLPIIPLFDAEVPSEQAPAPLCAPARPAVDGAECRPLKSSEPLVSTTIVSCADCPVDVEVFTEDLFNLFKSHCGGCHVENNLGEFQATANTFPTVVDVKVLDALRSNDPKKVMPPLDAGGKIWSERPEGDAIRDLVALIERWIEAGRPADAYIVSATEGGTVGDSRYYMPEALAGSLTNIGSCVPDPGMVATEYDKSCELDLRFNALVKAPPGSKTTPAERVGLPQRLEETDLFTLDSEVLAQHGVIAFAPTYPLWSDAAGKLRHVRVPLGQSIKFDKVTQKFEIPEKTRFYKTFLRKILQKDGVSRWRKIETRLIVAGKAPLFGSYAWNEAETEARLITDPLRNGEPFRDRLVTVIVDEPAAEKIRNKVPPVKNLAYALDDAHAIRRYAIPGSDRCIQCHMGSANESFVLGFTPMQLLRRPAGEGGVIEPAEADELTQLQRLIEYGVITGMDSPADVVLLEDSQGTRKARNQHELDAQGYMVGNCAHCHNPNGFPSVRNPELRDLLDFWPDADGGIFQFPLERFSPRIKRGLYGETPIPYITPSLRDLVPASTPDRAVALATDTWVPKGAHDADPPEFVPAPWRSLIYRNVDTAFTYAEDYAIYPHMPFSTPGLDCRASQLLGEWMVSIPAARKNPALNENGTFISLDGGGIDNTPQPYVEVLEDEARYPDALRQVEKRLKEYREGERYKSCEPSDDIQDIEINRQIRTGPRADKFRIPTQPHWAVTDLTEVPGAWNPRRTDWQKVLSKRELPEPVPPPSEGKSRVLEAEREVVTLLESVRLTDSFKDFALKELPFGLWEDKAGCDFSSTPRVKDYPPGERPSWMAGKPEAAPVYTALAGGAVFKMICVNCHGNEADSKGILASTLADITGGSARVANLRDGLFGPPGEIGANRTRVFSLDGLVEPAQDLTADDWGARYMAWMALGGTKQTIPHAILNLVANTEVLGVPRRSNPSNLSANMLTVAQDRCLDVLPFPPDGVGEIPIALPDLDLDQVYGKTALIASNGDTNLWQELCNRDNPAPVRAVFGDSTGGKITFALDSRSFYARDGYPANAPIGNHAGATVTGLTIENRFPWCFKKPDPGLHGAAEIEAEAVKLGLPFCPPALLADANLFKAYAEYHAANPSDYRDDFRKWSQRGAINAGLAVFLYLNEVAKGYARKPDFNKCELLGKP